MKLQAPVGRTEWISTINQALIYGCLFFIALIWVSLSTTAIPYIFYKYAQSYTEGVVASSIFHVSSDPWIYGDLNQHPFLLMPYNPFYSYLSFFLSGLTGHNFVSGRLITWISCLGCVWVIYLILRKNQVKRSMAFLWSSISVCIPIVSQNTYHMIPDFLALLFSLLGLHFLTYLHQNSYEKSKHWFLGIFFMFLSFMTKQNFVIAMLAYGAHLLFSKRFKSLGVYIAGLSLMIIPSMVLLQLGSGGHYLKHIWFSPTTIYLFSIDMFFNFWKSYFGEIWVALIFAVISLTLCIIRKSWNPFVFYFVGSMMSSIILGKVGSGWNYFIEMSAAICIIAGMMLKKDLMTSFKGIVCMCLLIFFSYELAFGYRSLSFSPIASYENFNRTEKKFDEFGSLIKSAPGEILSENLGLLIANERPVTYAPFEYAQLSYMKKFDDTIIVDKMKKHEYSMIILETNIAAISQSGRFTKAIVWAIKQFYRPLMYKHGQFFYIPKKS